MLQVSPEYVTLEDEGETKYFRWVCDSWIWFEIDRLDLKWANDIADKRSTARANSKKNYAKGDQREGHFTGALGELTVASFLGKQYKEVATVYSGPDTSDVGSFEVKNSTYAKNWRMYVNQSTMKPDRQYILTTSCHHERKYMAIIGWAYGREIVASNGPEMLQWRSKEPVYWIGWHSLHTMETL